MALVNGGWWTAAVVPAVAAADYRLHWECLKLQVGMQIGIRIRITPALQLHSHLDWRAWVAEWTGQDGPGCLGS